MENQPQITVGQGRPLEKPSSRQTSSCPAVDDVLWSHRSPHPGWAQHPTLRAMPQSTRFTRLFPMAGPMAAQLQGLPFLGSPSLMTAWQPSVNVYAHGDCLEVCVDLAGVQKEDIHIEVSPHRLMIRGQRQPPESVLPHGPCRRILDMEILEGNFERVIDIPLPIQAERVAAKQDNGWLWITLPVLQREVKP